MVFKIVLAASAERDISDAVDYITQDSAAGAAAWLKGLFTAIETLSEFPLRYALIPESQELGRELR